jgi:protein-tyrosine phosphatase
VDRKLALGFADGAAGVVVVPDPTAGKSRLYLKLVDAWSRLESPVFAEHALPLATVRNFRDLGGLSAADGKSVRLGLIFRHGCLSGVSELDFSYLVGLGLKINIDLRDETEIARHPVPEGHRLPDDTVHVPLLVSGLDFWGRITDALVNGYAGAKGEAGLVALMRSVYTDFVVSEHSIAASREFVKALQEPTHLPLSYNCDTGIHRTGWATAIILMLLGVERSTIVADFSKATEALRGGGDYPTSTAIPRIKRELDGRGLLTAEVENGVDFESAAAVLTCARPDFLMVRRVQD